MTRFVAAGLQSYIAQWTPARCAETPPDGKKCKKGHTLQNLGTSRDNGWGCDCRNEPGGCKRGMTGFHQSHGVTRYRCEPCDYDMCDECYEAHDGVVTDCHKQDRITRAISVELSEYPSHWDMSAMHDIEMIAGLDAEAGLKNQFGRVDLDERDMKSIQLILDGSFRKVYTRDRRGVGVPDRLEVVKGFRIQNVQNWKEYVERQKEIRGEIESLKKCGNKAVCPRGHSLEPLGTTMDNGWDCNARNEGGHGCLSGITGYHQTAGMNRFQCSKCDFDYCEKCYLLHTGKKLCNKGHALVPLGTSRDDGWGCDGRSSASGCPRNNITSGVSRFRCDTCDFDLCDKCFQRHMGNVTNSVEDLKTSNANLLGPPLDADTNSVWLFHGTNDEAAGFITMGDFLVDKAGSNAGTLYGRGVYLAESCSKSDEYTRPNSEGLHCILLCRAILGNVLYTDEVAPDVDSLVRQCLHGTYHSVLGDREKSRGTFREFIVYDDDQVYPEFLIWYRRIYGPPTTSSGGSTSA